MNKTERVFASEVEFVESAEILVDISTRDEPVLGLKFLSDNGERLIVPLTLQFAEEIAKQLLSYAITYRKVAEHTRA